MSKENSLKLSLFEQKMIRRVWHNDEWYYSITDVITILTNTDRPRKYWNDLKHSQVGKHGSSSLEPLVHCAQTVPHGTDAEHEG